MIRSYSPHVGQAEEITMTDEHENTNAAADAGVQPIAADAVTDPAMVPMDDDAGGRTADKEQMNEPSAEEAAALLGEMS
jgi:hypothetical protein